jgi:hypothetical protein
MTKTREKTIGDLETDCSDESWSERLYRMNSKADSGKDKVSMKTLVGRLKEQSKLMNALEKIHEQHVMLLSVEPLHDEGKYK